MSRDKRTLTLPTDSTERKNVPLLSGCFKYFPAALAGVAQISKLGNDKHNPGQPMHHARGKSNDHGDCILRHLTDVQDLLAIAERTEGALTPKGVADLLLEASQLAWRALAYAQQLHEDHGGAPLAPGAVESAASKKDGLPLHSKALKEPYFELQVPTNPRKPQLGDTVRILASASEEKYSDGRGPGWDFPMNKHIGQTGKVTAVNSYTCSVRVFDKEADYSWRLEDVEVL